VAIVVRFRRSSEVVRSQLKLVVWALALVPLIFVTGSIAPHDLWINTAVFVGALAAVPIAITVAIVRHNLFDIDVVISRSVTFGVLAVFIGGVYVGIVVGVGELFGGAGSSSFGLSVVATAVVALGFQPVRVWVEGWANRLVYGKRATPYEVLARFSHRAAEESDEDVVGRIPRLIVDGTGAVEAVVWVSEGDGFRAVAVWPESDGVRRVDSDLFEVAGADVSLPVFHDGEILGGISLVAARGGSITPPERELVENLADGLGLTLRNGQLTAQLRRQVKDLQRSRDRVVSAADEARRSLEHDLDSGPLQQLVAVKVKLGPIRKLAEQAAATRTAQVLADIDAQTGDAIQAVRDFAAGVYPPLLGAEGLVAALTHELHKAAIPVELATQHVDRYPRDIESAVYFAVLEALQNTAKYANATHAVVRLSDTDGVLEFDVTDNGQGFDPATVTKGAGLNGITDRIDTIGGTTTITSTPNHGTTITGAIPIKEPTSSAMVPQ
jgi:signal transduction histidine kinase